jgi:pSer/pThr/pTyr-binding forkhead associated (FHA) protein
MRFRLRYKKRDLDLSEGQFSVGRSSTCQLFLDDPLVSRRHAVFFVTDRGVWMEDQQSRNGVLVNERRVAGRVELRAGDRIQIGSQELSLDTAPEDVARAVDNNAGKMTLSRVATNTDRAAPNSHRPSSRGGPPPEVETDPSTVRRLDAFRMISSVAEKALAMGRHDEAERLLAGPLTELVEASRSGRPLSILLVDTVSALVAKLATATGKGEWVGLIIELYHAQARPFSAAVADELYIAFRRASGIDTGGLKGYLATLRDRQATFGPAERFLLQRVEGLERLALLR